MAVGRARTFLTFVTMVGGLAVCAFVAPKALAQSSSVSAWNAADFRIWGFVPNWATQTQINNFTANGSYDHVSDVLYFGGVQPKADGSLYYTSTATGHINALKNAAATRGFALHSSMFTVNGGTVEDVHGRADLTHSPVDEDDQAIAQRQRL